jgi:hypothetical protein
MHDNRICQFIIPHEFFETPMIIAASMFGMVVLRANPGSREPGGPPVYTHYIAWHPKFPATAFNILGVGGQRPEAPWVDLVISEPDAETGKVTLAWRRNKAPKDDFLWSMTVDCDPETLMSLPGLKGVAGHG